MIIQYEPYKVYRRVTPIMDDGRMLLLIGANPAKGTVDVASTIDGTRVYGISAALLTPVEISEDEAKELFRKYECSETFNAVKDADGYFVCPKCKIPITTLKGQATAAIDFHTSYNEYDNSVEYDNRDDYDMQIEHFSCWHCEFILGHIFEDEMETMFAHNHAIDQRMDDDDSQV